MLEFVPEGSAEPILNLTDYLSLREENKDEDEIQSNDPVIKFQIEYNTDVCMVQKFPEAMELEGVTIHHESQQCDELLNKVNNKIPSIMPNVTNNSPSHTFPAIMPNVNNDSPSHTFPAIMPNVNNTANQLHEIAPGEGKTPINLVFCQDWDAKAFPMLHPDGKNHLFDKRRKKKLRDQEYFKQRLFNKDPRWRRNTHWVFASTVYREKKDFRRNIDLAFKQGKKKTNKEGRSKYHLEDPYSVFQSVLNTPAYHKKGKYEFMARLDNFGPFHVFFTVSCADYHWQENVAAVLRERGIGLRYSFDSIGTENYEVYWKEQWMPMSDYTANEMDETLHTVFKKNVVTATRVYQHKVQALMTEIICNKNNPLSVKHYSIKLEFAGRGAGHNHGVLWFDVDKLETKVNLEQLREIIGNDT